MSKEYNWWTDPANAEEVEKHSWWDHEKNKETFPLPISVVFDGKYYTATCNKDTEKYLGKRLHGCAFAKTKEEAIQQMFNIIKLSHEWSHQEVLSYQRWVPLRKGDWSHTAGKWFIVFGIHVYFRYGRGMKGGWYIPFTKLNISTHSEWAVYRRYKKEKNGQ